MPNTMDPTLIQTVLQAGVAGLFLWYLIRVQIPENERRADAREQRAADAIAKLHADCAEERRQDRVEFSAALADERATHERQTNRLADALDKLETRADFTRTTNGSGGHKG